MFAIAAALLAAQVAPAAYAQASASAPTATPIPIERLAQLPIIADPVLSPDGTRIAARITDGGRERIGVWRVGDSATAPRTIPADNVISYQWAGDERLLVEVHAVVLITGHIILPVPVRRVVSYDLASGRATALGSGGGLYDEVIFVAPAGHYVLLSTQTAIDTTPSVHRIDLATGASVRVQPPRRGVWSWFADAEGVVRAGVDYDERRTRIFYRATADAPLRLVDSQRVVRDESVIDMIRFVANTERGIVVSNADTGRFAIYEYDFAADVRGPAIFAHPEVDVTRAVIGRDGTVEGVVYEDDRPRTHWFNPALGEIQRSIDRTFPDRTNVIVNRSRDGNRMLIWSSAADDPGTYYVYDRAARRMETFASPLDSLQELRFAPVRHVEYPSRDGVSIRAYLTLPPGRGERGLPLVVLPHGGPFLRDSWIFDQDVQMLASRGYAVLQPNFRGSTGYGRDFVERGYGQLGLGMIDDIDDGVEWLVREGVADARRVCIMGFSYGGYAATWAAMRSPERYRCAISWAGPSDLRAMLRYNSRSFIPDRYVRQIRRQLHGEDRVDLGTVSPLRQTVRLRVPLLIAHGERDVIVPVAHSRDLVAALTRRNAPNIESVFYPKAGHSFTSPEERIDFYRRVEAFLTRHNPAQPPAN